jgi:hypothetical protein
MVESLLAKLADRYPSALYAPDRYAVQFVVQADGADAALRAGVGLWRKAARQVRMPGGDLVRAEVKTPAELVAEYEHAEETPAPPNAAADEETAAAAYETTRRLVQARSPREVVSVLWALVRQLGGTVIPMQAGDPRIIDIDVSLGMGEPMAAAAEPYSISRLCLEEVLPAAVDDACRMVGLLGGGAAQARAGAATAPGRIRPLEVDLP